MEEKISEAFGLPAGWFDMPLGSALPAPAVQSIKEPPPTPYLAPRENDESKLLRAFRLASPDLRRSLIRQAEGILKDLNNPSQLTGNATDPG